MITRIAVSAAALVLATSISAMAADAPYMTADPAPAAPAIVDYAGDDFVFELGIEGIAQPDYYGSDNYEISPSAIFSVEYLNIPGLGSFGGPDGLGLSIGPSLVFKSERDSSDYRDLRGLDDIDTSYELGGKIGYEWKYAEIYGALRYSVGGAEGFVGEVGANLIARPTDQLTLKLGPTASFADSDYMDDYFGVSPRESLRTNGRLDAYDAGSGFKSVGVAASAKYEIFTDYFINADAKYDRLVGDAADSPVVRAGDKNQYYFGLGISKRFSLDLF